MEKLKKPAIFDSCEKAGTTLEEVIQTFRQSAEYYTLIENNLINSDRVAADAEIVLYLCFKFVDYEAIVCHVWDEKNKKFVKKVLNGGLTINGH